jgi:hypothetical protein
MPTTGRVLWTGAPHPSGAAKDRRRRLVGLLLGLAGVAFAWWSWSSVSLDPIGTVILVIILASVARPLLSQLRPSGPAPDARYTITERHVIVEQGGRRHGYRLASLGELTLSVDRDGLGTIRFARPIPERSREAMQLLARILPLPDRSQPLLEHISQPDRVMRILRDAQREDLAAETTGPTAHDGARPDAGAQEVHETAAIRAPSGWLLYARSPLVLAMLVFFASEWVILPVMGLSSRLEPWGHFVIPGILAIATYVLLRGWLLFRAERLRRAGATSEGMIAELIETNYNVNERHQWLVSNRFRDGTGREHVGFSQPMDHDEADSWGVGDIVTVRYDPAHPERSALVT